MENGFLYERMLEIQSLHWSQNSGRWSFPGNCFLLNYFHHSSEVTLCLSWRPPTQGTSHHHTSLESILLHGPGRGNLRHGESRYGLLLISLAVWILPTLGDSFVVCGEKYSWNWNVSFQLRVLFKPQMLGLKDYKNSEEFSILSVFYMINYHNY